MAAAAKALWISKPLHENWAPRVDGAPQGPGHYAIISKVKKVGE